MPTQKNKETKNKEMLSTKRTYVLLQMGILKLLTEMPFEKITLTEICNCSMVPRSTFYRYFEDKYDLLSFCLRNFFEDIHLDENVLYLRDMDSIQDALTKSIQVLDANRDRFLKICQLNKDGIFFDYLRSLLIQIMTEKLKAFETPESPLKISYPIFTYLMADFLISLAKCYLENGEKYTVEEFVKNVSRFANKDFFD